MKKEFRIYDKAHSRMVYSSIPEEQGKREYYPFYFGIGFSHWEMEDVSEPMMFTGLLDKNKKKIWEDDLFITEHGIMKVFFIDGRFILMWADNGTFYQELYKINNCIEVAGNIYEYSITTKQTLKKNKK